MRSEAIEAACLSHKTRSRLVRPRPIPAPLASIPALFDPSISFYDVKVDLYKNIKRLLQGFAFSDRYYIRGVVTVQQNDIDMKRLMNGDLQAFERFIEQYQAYVFAIILRFVNDPDDAQDIAQEVFLQLYRSLPQYRPENLKAWVGKIATNKAIDAKRRRARQGELLESNVEAPFAPRQSEMNPDQMLTRLEKEERIKALCRELPPSYSRVLMRYYFEHQSYQQIAREEGISLKTVESRLYRARKILRKRWEEGT